MSLQKLPKVLVIVGPTASGKSALGVALAKKFGGEIVSADSRQVYRGLDIGTGKITLREMRGVPHYLLDVASPKRTYTAHAFARAGRAVIKKISHHGHLPIIVGGTGFYIDALLGTIPLSDVPPQKKLRTRLQKKTVAELFVLLQKKDPDRAVRMDTPSERNNKHRLIRALEIAYAPKKTRHTPRETSFESLWIGIKPNTDVLAHKIEVRLHARIKSGMIAEARRLHAEGLSYKRMEALGLEYRALARFLQKKTTRTEFEAELLREIRAYAKRQITYWKRNTKIMWFDPKDVSDIERCVANFLI